MQVVVAENFKKQIENLRPTWKVELLPDGSNDDRFCRMQVEYSRMDNERSFTDMCLLEATDELFGFVKALEMDGEQNGQKD